MLVWGGQELKGATYRADGAVFDPTAKTWSSIPKAPLEPRGDHVAVWTGTQMIVWGGGIESPRTGMRSFADGAAYDPTARRWSRLPPSPLEARILHTAVWTGSALLVWGGADTNSCSLSPDICSVLATMPLRAEDAGPATQEDSTEDDESDNVHLLADGAAYDAVTRTWAPMAASPLAPRIGHVAVWTGKEMLVWGGTAVLEGPQAFNDGAAYNPSTNSWRRIAAAPVHAGAVFASVWTGSRMIIWGGPNGDGAAYDPDGDRWMSIAKAPLPPLGTPTAVWTGRLAVVWGAPDVQPDPQHLVAEGAAFDLAKNRWTLLAPAMAAPGQGDVAVWTGNRMLVWGGFSGDGPLSFGGEFAPT
jgi:hypothetical protein